MAEKIPHVVIVGAGFGGLKAAKLLAGENIRVTLIDKENYHLFQPLLYQVATSELSTNEIAYPIRSFFKTCRNVDFFMAEVTGFDTENKKVQTDRGDVDYDYLILAAGATTNFFGMETVEKNSYPMKSLPEALLLRDHIIQMFEQADRIDDPEVRKRLLTFICVGGGPTGVEMAGALSELVYKVMEEDYHKFNFREVSIQLVEAMDSVLLMMPETLRKEAADVLEHRLNVEVKLQAQVMDYDGQTLFLKDGTEIPTETVIWAAGVKAVPVIAKLGAETDRAGRVMVNEYLQVKGFKEIFAIGDCAHFEQDGRPLATIAPVATQQAIVCVQNLIKLINFNNEPWTPFEYKDVGSMATISNGQAVVAMDTRMGKIQLTGFLAWMAWMVVHIARLAGKYTNIVVIWKWLLNYFIDLRLGRIVIFKEKPKIEE